MSSMLSKLHDTFIRHYLDGNNRPKTIAMLKSMPGVLLTLYLLSSILTRPLATYALPFFLHGRPRGGRMNAGLPPTPTVYSPPPAQWFTQRLNHFDPQDARTFNQQFQVNASHYVEGGPIFLLLGGEGPANPLWLSANTAIME